MPEYVRTQIRLPADLYEKVVKGAEDSARSLNAEMVVRIESSFRSGVDLSQQDGGSGKVYLREFQRDLFEQVRRIVRLEALMGAPKLTKEQKEEMAALKRQLEKKD